MCSFSLCSAKITSKNSLQKRRVRNYLLILLEIFSGKIKFFFFIILFAPFPSSLFPFITIILIPSHTPPLLGRPVVPSDREWSNINRQTRWWPPVLSWSNHRAASFFFGANYFWHIVRAFLAMYAHFMWDAHSRPRALSADLNFKRWPNSGILVGWWPNSRPLPFVFVRSVLNFSILVQKPSPSSFICSHFIWISQKIMKSNKLRQ